MPKNVMIKSRLHDYSLEFVNEIQPVIENLSGKGAFFIIDKTVHRLYPQEMNAIPENRIFVIEATEQNKTLDGCERLIKELIDQGIRRNDTVVAIGGGIIQDITAFVSSILFRGVEWLFIPTTLLAQADSCIGGKTSINFQKYKNLLGNFYPPTRVFIESGFLKTLSAEDMKSGIGEMLHFYLIEGSLYARQIAQDYERLFKERFRLREYIIASLDIKRKVIERDEFDKGERNLFNYGHTFGHAIETVSDYAVAHGQAVTLGMDIANYLSLQRGLLSETLFQEMHTILIKNMPAFEITESNLDRYMRALKKDKKNSNEELTCILTQGPGRMRKVCIPLNEQLGDSILSYFNHRLVKV